MYNPDFEGQVLELKKGNARPLIYLRKEELLRQNWSSEGMPYTGSRTGHAFNGGS